jgi:monoterpene epsilon-lactone hydrolase
MRLRLLWLGVAAVAMMAGKGLAQQAPVATSVQGDSTTISEDGTVYITRIVPIPKTVSPEAAKFLSRVVPDTKSPPLTIEQIRAIAKSHTDPMIERAKILYPVKTVADTIAGVPVSIVTPLTMESKRSDRVLINIHGGAFHEDWSSVLESLPIANLTGMKVVSVLYRMAPEHPFPAASDDVVAVYKELLKTYKSEHIGIYGSSAGAMLTGEVTAELKVLKLPMPGATGVFSGWADFSTLGGDSLATYTLAGLAGHMNPPALSNDPNGLKGYTGATDLKDPVLSPLYSDMTGFPPTLFVTSTRDALLSGTTIMHRAYLRAGVDARLVVFEALPHTFWENVDLPESKECHEVMAKFFVETVGR